MVRRLRIRRGETVTVTRVTRDGTADDQAPLPDVAQTAFGKPGTVTVEDDQRGRRFAVERNWFCPRDADVQAGDRITRSNGDTYTVFAGPFGDTDHPLTGTNFGVKRFRVRRIGAPRG